jgi:hypothetical protein
MLDSFKFTLKSCKTLSGALRNTQHSHSENSALSLIFCYAADKYCYANKMCRSVFSPNYVYSLMFLFSFLSPSLCTLLLHKPTSIPHTTQTLLCTARLRSLALLLPRPQLSTETTPTAPFTSSLVAAITHKQCSSSPHILHHYDDLLTAFDTRHFPSKHHHYKLPGPFQRSASSMPTLLGPDH